MTRVFLELSTLFLLPFAAYALFSMWHGRHPREARRILEAKALRWQALFGLLLVAATLFYVGLTTPNHQGAYSPATFKDGKFISGKVD